MNSAAIAVFVTLLLSLGAYFLFFRGKSCSTVASTSTYYDANANVYTYDETLEECVPSSCSEGYYLSGTTCYQTTSEGCEGITSDAYYYDSNANAYTYDETLGECVPSSCVDGYTPSGNYCSLVEGPTYIDGPYLHNVDLDTDTPTYDETLGPYIHEFDDHPASSGDELLVTFFMSAEPNTNGRHQASTYINLTHTNKEPDASGYVAYTPENRKKYFSFGHPETEDETSTEKAIRLIEEEQRFLGAKKIESEDHPGYYYFRTDNIQRKNSDGEYYYTDGSDVERNGDSVTKSKPYGAYLRYDETDEKFKWDGNQDTRTLFRVGDDNWPQVVTPSE